MRSSCLGFGHHVDGANRLKIRMTWTGFHGLPRLVLCPSSSSRSAIRWSVPPSARSSSTSGTTTLGSSVDYLLDDRRTDCQQSVERVVESLLSQRLLGSVPKRVLPEQIQELVAFPGRANRVDRGLERPELPRLLRYDQFVVFQQADVLVHDLLGKALDRDIKDSVVLEVLLGLLAKSMSNFIGKPRFVEPSAWGSSSI